MKKKSIKLLVVLACVLMALGMAGCGKKAYKTFPEKYKLASVDVGGMTADEAKKAIKTAVGKYKISVKLDDKGGSKNGFIRRVAQDCLQ
jgi:predicted small lipoprotein YifL